MLTRSRFSLVFLVLDETLSWHTNFHVALVSHAALPIPTSKYPLQRSPQGVQNSVIMQPFKHKIRNAARMFSLILNAHYLSTKPTFTKMTRGRNCLRSVKAINFPPPPPPTCRTKCNCSQYIPSSLLLSNLLSPLCRVITIIYLKQTMFLWYTVLQLFYIHNFCYIYCYFVGRVAQSV